MNQNLPPGWDEERIRRIIEHYESQTEDEAVAEDEAAFSRDGYAIVPIPHEILHEVMLLVQDFEDRRSAKGKRK